jgi:hypothetical protein
LQKKGYDEGNNRAQFMNLIKKFPNTYKGLRSKSPRITFEMMKLMTQKGVYPYSFVDSEDKYDCAELPSIEDFYDDLNKVECSAKDYEHALKVWKVFGCETFKDYHDLYLRSDVNLLADVFEGFRTMGMNYYGLDPAWYITLPQYANDCLYKFTGHEQELFTDIDMYLWIEQSIRGGISVISHRHAQANNEYMKNFNPDAPLSWLVYADTNNLYGNAMSQKLPYRDFKWRPDLITPNIVRMIEEYNNGNKGYVLEVDLLYPKELHDLHNDYPLAPEHMEVDKCSITSHSMLQKSNVKPIKCDKLVGTLYDKKHYVVHIRNLQYYMAHGLVLDKVHRILEFEQIAWMQPYIGKLSLGDTRTLTSLM